MKKFKNDTLYSLLSLILVFSAGLVLGFFTDKAIDEFYPPEEATVANSTQTPDYSQDLENLDTGRPLVYKEWLKEKEFKNSNLLIEDLDQTTCQEIIDYHQEMLNIPDTHYSIS